MCRNYPMDTVFTNSEGIPYVRPEREEYPRTIDGHIEYWRAVAEYRQRIANDSLAAFDAAFRAGLTDDKANKRRKRKAG